MNLTRLVRDYICDNSGEIIQSNVTPSNDAAKGSSEATTANTDNFTDVWTNTTVEVHKKSMPFEKQKSVQTRVLQKDEFGRDVEVSIQKQHKSLKHERKECRKKERMPKHKDKKYQQSRGKSSERSRSPSLHGRFIGTPPPPDPFRPQLDEDRGSHSLRRRYDSGRSRTQSRTRSRRHSCHQSHEKRYRRDSSRSRSRSRGRNRSRSPPSSRFYCRRSSASVERKWTHNAFVDRSPSPPRRIDPFYRPEPEGWVSRAGGVYLPRK